VLKLFQGGYAVASLAKLREYDLLKFLFPTVDARLRANEAIPTALCNRALANTDVRVLEEKPITPAFLYAALLWPDVQEHYEALLADDDMPPIPAMHAATDRVLDAQLRITALPKRFSAVVREIWTLETAARQRAEGRRNTRRGGRRRSGGGNRKRNGDRSNPKPD